jgi:hypothetical protein
LLSTLVATAAQHRQHVINFDIKRLNQMQTEILRRMEVGTIMFDLGVEEGKRRIKAKEQKA